MLFALTCFVSWLRSVGYVGHFYVYIMERDNAGKIDVCWENFCDEDPCKTEKLNALLQC